MAGQCFVQKPNKVCYRRFATGPLIWGLEWWKRLLVHMAAPHALFSDRFIKA